MKFITTVYLSQRLYLALVVLILLFLLGHFTTLTFALGKLGIVALGSMIIIDLLLLFSQKNSTVLAVRQVPLKLSNGDSNQIMILISNGYNLTVKMEIIDELPFQLQIRNFIITQVFAPKQEQIFAYDLIPKSRGEYHFGKVNVYVSSSLGLIKRRFKCANDHTAAVYPGFLQMRRFEIMAISNRLTEAGIKKIRRINNYCEFDQIKEYVQGDDYRTLNWQATARMGQLMVNQYQDEKAQQVYCLIDKGRTMKSPFNGMSLLDHAINASLVLSNIAILKQDKAGLISFSDKIDQKVAASRKPGTMGRILEVLYKQESEHKESNYELLYMAVTNSIKQRSLLLLFTNFEGLPSLRLQLNALKRMAKKHLVVVVFFQNNAVELRSKRSANDLEEIYIQTIAEKFAYEKKQIIKELKKNGIYAVLTDPENLTVNTINKYLELKGMGLI